MLTLKSNIDKSVNFIHDGFECRFVQREPHYFIIYVSSFKGCDQACRMCHLTQDKQTDMTPAYVLDVMRQVDTVFSYAKENVDFSSIKKIHINFMAKGELLLNTNLSRRFKALTKLIREDIREFTQASVKFKVSTIMPEGFNFNGFNEVRDEVEFYYSLYSVDENFRKRWLPKAHDPRFALAKLCTIPFYVPITIHHALIDDENDSVEDAKAIVDYIVSMGDCFKFNPLRFNLVAYNPFSPNQGLETTHDRKEAYLKVFRDSGLFERVKEVPRVGFDVKASCGMFVEKSK